jgi:hypothetical protein
MISDTIMVRVDTDAIRSLISRRTKAEGQNVDELLERVLQSLQRQIEEEISEFEQGNGNFESCFYESL